MELEEVRGVVKSELLKRIAMDYQVQPGYKNGEAEIF